MNALKREKSQQDSLAATTSLDRSRLLREVEALSAEVAQYQQHVCPQDAAPKEALRQAKYDNEVLARENRELAVQVQ